MRKFKISKRAILLTLSTLVMIGFVSLSVTSCALPDELDQNNIVNQFFPNFWVFLAHIIAVVILFVVTIFFLWKPTKQMISARSEAIQKNIDDAKRAQEEAEKYLQQANEKRLNASIEAQKIVDNSTNEAYRIKFEMEEKAKRSADLIIQNAKRELVRQENTLRKQLQNEMIDIAITATESLTRKSISRSENEEYIKKLIAELEETDID